MVFWFYVRVGRLCVCLDGLGCRGYCLGFVCFMFVFCLLMWMLVVYVCCLHVVYCYFVVGYSVSLVGFGHVVCGFFLSVVFGCWVLCCLVVAYWIVV